MRYFLIGLLCLLPMFAQGAVATDIADDPVTERRMMLLAEKVRCLVCQSEPVSNSHSDWSKDVRQIMRDKMKAGATDQQILDLLVERFGKSVLFDPPVDKETMPLWAAPFVLLLLGGLGLGYQLRKRSSVVQEAELSAADELRVASLLNETVSAQTRASNPMKDPKA
jgi:cytochrome c-type biogenesis protein CcmH